MRWLTPLGFLGLIGLIALIIIYIIKPNFQNKIISSTFIWKRSLKYKRKKIPISKLRNILLFICQVLIITGASLILAQPFLRDQDASNGEEAVLIIDASASMLSESGGITRFERAVTEASTLVDELFEDEKRVSIIVASDKAYFLAQQATVDSATDIKASLEALLDISDPGYTYATPDIDGAIKLAEEITAYTANTKVTLYTDSTYYNKGKVDVVNVSDTSDWNAAILDVRSKIVENMYVFEVDVACYGKDTDVDVSVDFYGVNFEESNISYQVRARCSNDEVQTIIFSADTSIATEVTDIYQFDYVHAYISEYDSLSLDNNFYLYGGKRPVFKIQYHSAYPNNYFTSALLVLRNALSNYWDIEITEVKPKETPATEGFDLYIFEHQMPSTIPTDGIVMFSDPDQLPASSGIKLGKTYTSSGAQQIPLEPGDAHPIMNNINPENITVTRFIDIVNNDDFTPLMYVEDHPVMMVKNDPDAKIVVMAFSHNFSNLAIKPEFPLLMLNIVKYFAPQTLDGFVFDINESVNLNARGEALNVVGPGIDTDFEELPASMQLTETGVYTVTQDLLSGEVLIENFYVKLSAEESNINQKIDELANPYYYQEPDLSDMDLLLYFAIALVALLFIEWWLKSREQI